MQCAFLISHSISLYIQLTLKLFFHILICRKMASTSSLRRGIAHFLFVFLVCAAVSGVGASAFSSNFQFPKIQAEKLIRSLNLFPKHGANQHAAGEDVLGGASPIVEKPVRFPFMADSEPSVKDLGHHAGYYRLPHTKDAR